MTRKTPKVLPMPTVARKRRSYEDRCGMAGRAAKAIAKVVSEQTVFVEDAEGRLLRDWSQPHERLSNDDLRIALLRCRAVEEADLLEHVSPGVIRYAVSQRWLVKRGDLFWVTAIAAKHLNLPARDGSGVTIKFLAV